MNFKFFMVFVILTISFVGSIFAQSAVGEKEFTQIEIDEMKNKAVLITMNDGTFLIELFPEDAPNTVNNFLKLVESDYYDGMIFHRIISGFIIQTGDPNTKDLGIDRSLWGTGGPGYSISEEFNNLQHDRGMVSMARSQDVDSAGSQFFIVHKDSSFLDGKYTVFGRLVPGTHSISTLDTIANIPTDGSDAPLDISKATIIKANILDSFSTSDFPEPDRNYTSIEQTKIAGGTVEKYIDTKHKIKFDLPYRWNVVQERVGEHIDLIVEPTSMEHNVQIQIDETGFTPQLLIFSEERDVRISGTEPGPGFFSIQAGDKPKILSDYIFENDDGRYAHLMVSTQIYQTQTETVKFKIMQIHFTNSEANYSVIYINVADWFRYEINAFYTVVKDFEIMIDGVQQPIGFADEPIFKRIIADARATEELQELPPARVGGCLIATATFGSEMAPQVQFLRELRDNTVLQTESGTSFMAGFNQFYYSFSPAIADYERENPIFKEAVKLIITPLLTSLTLLQYADIDSESDMLGYGIGVILLNIGMYFIAPAVLITKIRSFYKLQ
jgi:peptidyl-prolyl cis-trans isomerase B (cyclophilin B)